MDIEAVSGEVVYSNCEKEASGQRGSGAGKQWSKGAKRQGSSAAVGK
jgi:hypothetical protein